MNLARIFWRDAASVYVDCLFAHSDLAFDMVGGTAYPLN
jgi:hypothetical protein